MSGTKTKNLILLASFLIFSSMVIIHGGTHLFWNALALGGFMITCWILELIPIYVTALFPLVFAVPLGLIDPTGIAKSYGNSMIFLFLGGFIVALALEKWDIHTQIAKGIIRIIGKTKHRIVLGFLVSTAVLSMWISNTATALMMLPMALAVIHSIPKKDQKSRFSLYLLLAIAYGSSVGGMATLVGSPPNIQMAGILKSQFQISISFFDWFKYGFPLSFLLLGVVYLIFYIGLGKERNEELNAFSIEKKPWTSNQKRVLVVFLFLVIIWTLKELIIPIIGFSYSDESAALLASIFLFIIPSEGKKEKTILLWSDTTQLPWGILLLFGSGLALATCLTTGGVIDALAKEMSSFGSLPYFILLLVLISIAIFGTEVMSNLALVTVFIPVIGAFATQSDFPILQLCMPITLAASCAFMLPIGTPPNAIVFASGNIKISQMAKIGFLLNIAASLLISLFAYWLI